MDVREQAEISGAQSGLLIPAKSRSSIRILPGRKLNFAFRGTKTDAEHGDSVRPAREWMTCDILIAVAVFGRRQRIDELPQAIGSLYLGQNSAITNAHPEPLLESVRLKCRCPVKGGLRVGRISRVQIDPVGRRASIRQRQNPYSKQHYQRFHTTPAVRLNLTC